MPRIIHVCRAEKFIPPFVKLVDSEFESEDHYFFVFGNHRKYPINRDQGIHRVGRGWRKIISKIYMMRLFLRCDRIVVHGLFNRSVTNALFLVPRLLRKTYWVIWGADLYAYKKLEGRAYLPLKEKVRRRVIRKMGHLVTYVEGDVALAREQYGARGQYHECLMYPSNLYHPTPLPDASPELCVLVGNSADPSNNHREIFERLAEFRGQEMKVFVPLSYGDKNNAERVRKLGKELLGDKFVPLNEFMPFDDYLHFLADIDIAILNHKRQQAMGNAITLLGLGKKVYLRTDVTSWRVFEKQGIKTFDVSELDLSAMDPKDASRNQAAVENYFSRSRLVSQLNNIFEEH